MSTEETTEKKQTPFYWVEASNDMRKRAPLRLLHHHANMFLADGIVVDADAVMDLGADVYDVGVAFWITPQYAFELIHCEDFLGAYQAHVYDEESNLGYNQCLLPSVTAVPDILDDLIGAVEFNFVNFCDFPEYIQSEINNKSPQFSNAFIGVMLLLVDVPIDDYTNSTEEVPLRYCILVTGE